VGDVVGETVRETTCAHTRSPPPPPPRSWKRTLTHLRSPCFCVRLVCRDTSTGLPASACTVRRARTNDASAACRTKPVPDPSSLQSLQSLQSAPRRGRKPLWRYCRFLAVQRLPLLSQLAMCSREMVDIRVCATGAPRWCRCAAWPSLGLPPGDFGSCLHARPPRRGPRLPPPAAAAPAHNAPPPPLGNGRGFESTSGGLLRGP
jgi:hypothetical protein